MSSQTSTGVVTPVDPQTKLLVTAIPYSGISLEILSKSVSAEVFAKFPEALKLGYLTIQSGRIYPNLTLPWV